MKLCTCMTKTPELKYHDEDCEYRKEQESKMTKKQPYRIVYDNDGHSYIIPWEETDKFYDLLENDLDTFEDLYYHSRIKATHRIKIYEWEEV